MAELVDCIQANLDQAISGDPNVGQLAADVLSLADQVEQGYAQLVQSGQPANIDDVAMQAIAQFSPPGPVVDLFYGLLGACTVGAPAIPSLSDAVVSADEALPSTLVEGVPVDRGLSLDAGLALQGDEDIGPMSGGMMPGQFAGASSLQSVMHWRSAEPHVPGPTGARGRDAVLRIAPQSLSEAQRPHVDALAGLTAQAAIGPLLWAFVQAPVALQAIAAIRPLPPIPPLPPAPPAKRGARAAASALVKAFFAVATKVLKCDKAALTTLGKILTEYLGSKVFAVREYATKFLVSYFFFLSRDDLMLFLRKLRAIRAALGKKDPQVDGLLGYLLKTGFGIWAARTAIAELGDTITSGWLTGWFERFLKILVGHDPGTGAEAPIKGHLPEDKLLDHMELQRKKLAQEDRDNAQRIDKTERDRAKARAAGNDKEVRRLTEYLDFLRGFERALEAELGALDAIKKGIKTFNTPLPK